MRISFLLASCLLIMQSHSIGHDDCHDGGHDHSTHQLGVYSFEYIENKGQWDDNVLFRTGTGPLSIFVEQGGITFSMLDPEDLHALHDIQHASDEEKEAFRMQGHAWKTRFVGASTTSVSKGESEQTYYYNYILGNNPNAWVSNARLFERVHQENLYPGIDIEYYGHEGSFKYDFIVAPGTSTELIQWNYEGLDGVKLNDDGHLVLKTSITDIMESAPFAYQIVAGKQVEVPCRYAFYDGLYGFEFPEGYRDDLPLIIDPELVAATLSGTTGFSSNYGHSATFDIAGNIYTGCVAGSDDYPVTLGAFQQTYGGGGWDIGISKLTPDGTDLIWATLIGGSNSDYPHSLIANNTQELYVYGSTSSIDFPTSDNAFQPNLGGGTDAIVVHLNEDGTGLIGSTFIGGNESDGSNENSLNYGDTYRGEIIIDLDGNPVVVSSTTSTDFPVTVGAYQSALGGEQDAVLFKMNDDLSNLIYSTYFGGPEFETGFGVRTLNNGTIFIAGGAGEGLPTTAGAHETEFQGGPGGGFFGSPDLDGFIARFSPDAQNLVASTYHGSEGTDQAFFLDTDFEDNIWIYGQCGDEMEALNAPYTDEGGVQFIAKFTTDLDELLINSLIGPGGAALVPDAFLVDNCDNIYISGYNAFGELETTDDALFESSDGGFYLAVYEEDMADIIFGTFYTGNHVDGGTSRFDKNGKVYQAVCSGGGFNTTADAWATDQEPGWDIGVFVIDFDAIGVNAAVAANDISGCAPFEITFENFSIGDQFLWDFGDGTTSTDYAPTYIYDEPGVYNVSLVASDSLSCNLADTVNFEITISTPQDFTPSFEYDVDCSTQSIELSNTTDIDFLEYQWDLGDGNTIESYDLDYTYDEPGDYVVSLIAIDNGCDTDEQISENIVIEPAVTAEIALDDNTACNDLFAQFVNESLNGVEFTWDFGDGNTSTEDAPEYVFTGPQSYDVILTATNISTCNGSDQDTLTIVVGADQVLMPDFLVQQTDCQTFTVETVNSSIGENVAYTWNMGDGSILEGEDVTYDYDEVGNFNVTLTMTDTLCDITEQLSLPVNITDEVVAIISNGDILGCAPVAVGFQTLSPGEASWDFGDDSPIQVGSSVEHVYDVPGIYTVTLSVVDDGACNGTDEVTSIVEVIEPVQLDPSFLAEAIGDCADLSFEFTDTSIGDAYQAFWDFGDGTTENGLEVTHIFPAVSSYDVTLTLFNEVCDIEVDITETITLDDGSEYDAGPMVPLCYNIPTVEINAGIEAEAYEWEAGGDEQSLEVSSSGLYPVAAQINGCWYRDTLEVFDVEELFLDRSTVQCETGANRVVIEHNGGLSYLWEDGTEGQILDISESGDYSFTVIDSYGCVNTGVIDAEIIPKEVPMFIPNAFSPNNDGVNDRFLPVTQLVEEYQFVVYDRWGDEVFSTEDPTQAWNGGAVDSEYYAIDGVYTYAIEYRGQCSSERIRKNGLITLLR